MIKRLVSLALAGGCLLFGAAPVMAQRAGDELVLWADDYVAPGLPVAQTVDPPPNKPELKKLAPEVWRTLAPFKDLAEFDAWRRRAAEIAKSHGSHWGFLRQRRADGPLLAQAEVTPCDPAVEECPGDALDEAVVTGMRVSAASMAQAAQSITNNQVATVDEGDIVKAFGRYLVVLLHGRLFSIDTGTAPGELRLIDRVDAYQNAEIEDWLDEILIKDDVVLVTGYSYETNSSNIGLYRIDGQGRFTFLARYFIESGDYYSWENYATRIVDGKLIIYTPYQLSNYSSDEPLPLPRVRRLEADGTMGEWRPLFTATQLYRPIQPSVYPTLHVLSVCPIAGSGALTCESRGIVGPDEHEMYVAPGHAYLWLATDADDARPGAVPDCEEGLDVFRQRGVPSAAYRLDVSSGKLGAIHTEGAPGDQFSLEEKGGTFWALVSRPPLDCDEVTDAEGEEYEPLVLLKIPAAAFSTRPARLPSSSYIEMPALGSRWDRQVRFAARYLMYGSADGDHRLIVVPLFDPTRHKQLALAHDVTRLELFGENAVIFGEVNRDLAATTVWLALQPRAMDTQIVPGAEESEGRSHAFNFTVNADGSGMFGLPIVYLEEQRRMGWRDAPTYVHFFRVGKGLSVDDAAELAGNPASAGALGAYECQVSCHDWYGNARPIFYRGRVFALIGHELIEGSSSGGRVVEHRRVNLTGPRFIAR